MRDHTLEVTVPARLLDNLWALALGYTMSRGQFLNARATANEAQWLLHEAGYETLDDTIPLFSIQEIL